MQFEIAVIGTKRVKYLIESPTLEEAEECALNAAKKHFTLVRLENAQDAVYTEIEKN